MPHKNRLSTKVTIKKVLKKIRYVLTIEIFSILEKSNFDHFLSEQFLWVNDKTAYVTQI